MKFLGLVHCWPIKRTMKIKMITKLIIYNNPILQCGSSGHERFEVAMYIIQLVRNL